MLGLQPDERGHAVELLTREMFMQGAATTERAMAVRAFVADLQQPGRAKDIAPDAKPLAIAAPLSADAWRDALQLSDRADLFAAFINNRAAMLVCAGAAASDPSTRALLSRDKGLLRWMVRTAPAAFWTASRSLKFDKDRLLVPGGPAAEPIWEALAVEKLSRPSEFLRALLSRADGRLAWFYEAAGTLTPARVRHGSHRGTGRTGPHTLRRVPVRRLELASREPSVPARTCRSVDRVLASRIGRRLRRSSERAVVLGRAVRPVRHYAAERREHPAR